LRRRGVPALATTLSLGIAFLSIASADEAGSPASSDPASRQRVEPGNETLTDVRTNVRTDVRPEILPDTADGDLKNACAERLAITIQAYYDAVDDFAASFLQKTRSVTLGNASLGSDAPSSGTVQFAKPGKMRWRYETPSVSQVISDGRILWIYDAEAQEAQRLPVADGYLTGAALEFLIGDGKILEEFDVEVTSCEPDAQDTLELKLLPKQAASFESLGLRAKRQTGEILGTSLIDLFGNETRISFSDTRINLHPDASTFVFEAPKGVSVIDLIPAP